MMAYVHRIAAVSSMLILTGALSVGLPENDTVILAICINAGMFFYMAKELDRYVGKP